MKSLLYHAFGSPCKRGRGSHSVARVSYGDSPPALLTLAVPRYRPCIIVPQIGFCFAGLPLFPSASWPLSFLSLFFLILFLFFHFMTLFVPVTKKFISLFIILQRRLLVNLLFYKRSLLVYF